eukprot:6474159-Pyramimonas_sp.AAC.1
MLAKASGGFRPIGLFVGTYRHWGRARRHFAEEWGGGLAAVFFWCGRFKSSSDVVWRRALRSEESVSCQEVSASVLWDMYKFYELFDLELLLD